MRWAQWHSARLREQIDTRIVGAVLDRSAMLQLRPRRVILGLDSLLPMQEPLDTMNLVLCELLPPDVVSQTYIEEKPKSSEEICEVIYVGCAADKEPTDEAGSMPRRDAAVVSLRLDGSEPRRVEGHGDQQLMPVDVDAPSFTIREAEAEMYCLLERIDLAVGKLQNEVAVGFCSRDYEAAAVDRRLELSGAPTSPPDSASPLRVRTDDGADLQMRDALQLFSTFGVVGIDAPTDITFFAKELRVWFSTAQDRMRVMMSPGHMIAERRVFTSVVYADNDKKKRSAICQYVPYVEALHRNST